MILPLDSRLFSIYDMDHRNSKIIEQYKDRTWSIKKIYTVQVILV